MKNEFSEQMSKRSDAELDKILEQQNDYQPDAVEAARQEINKRKIKRDQISKLSDEQLTDQLKSKQKKKTGMNQLELDLRTYHKEKLRRAERRLGT